MKKIISIVILLIAIVSCNQDKKHSEESEHPIASSNEMFDKYKNGFIELFWKSFPYRAIEAGYHKYDSILTIPDEKNAALQLQFIEANLDSLKMYRSDELSDNNKTDYYIIENQLNMMRWKAQEEREYEWNPSVHNVSYYFAELLNGTYDSLDVRLHNFNLKLQHVPAYYEAAKKLVKNPTLEHTQLAIDQNLGGVSIFVKDLRMALKKSQLGQVEKKQLLDRSVNAVRAINEYVDWLRKLDNKTPRSFRLGKELYAKKFQYEIQSGYTADEIYEKAIAHKKELHEKMFILADRLWQKYLGNSAKPADKLTLIKDVIDKISVKHTTKDSFQIAIEQQIPVLTAFIKQKDLLYLDPSKPLVVRKEPDYMAGVAGASISAPGPYDKSGNTYYNVGSLSGWDKEKVESYLREYNHYVLQILNIHEAIPGHYAQLVYSNQSPSLIKSVFGNGAMVEGWAVYTERMMLENGYGNNEDEMWLMYYKWNLRATCNTILDYSVHTKELSKEDALDLLIREGFQQNTEAENKWKRATLTQVQLCSYFTGYTEIYDFREELKKKMGDQFNLKSFHEKFLSYGSAPVKYIKELMMADFVKTNGSHK